MYTELLEKIKKAETRAEIFAIIHPLKVKELERINKLAGIPISPSNKNKKTLENKIISWFGSKIDANIILNLSLEE